MEIIKRLDVKGLYGFYDYSIECGCTSGGNVVLSTIFADLHVLSMFKWYNYKEHTNLSCDGGVDITGARVNDLQNPSWLLAQYQNTKANNNPRKVITASVAGYITFAATHSLGDFDLTNGHDFFKRLCGGVNGNMPKLPFPVVDGLVQTYYQPKYFSSTQLYADIVGWEASHVKILK